MGFKIIRVMINFLHHHLIKHLKYGLGGDSIPAVARERAQIGIPFCTPPGSPFRDLAPNADPLMEPTCHQGENIEKLYNPKTPNPTTLNKY
jgi:hypothetical protein